MFYLDMYFILEVGYHYPTSDFDGLPRPGWYAILCKMTTKDGVTIT